MVSHGGNGTRFTVHREDPGDDPVRDAIQTLPGAGRVTVRVNIESGTSGSGTVRFGRIQAAPDILRTLIERELKPEVIGTDPAFVRRTHDRLLEETEYHGSSGLARFGIAAVDTALWDCLGRTRGVPWWQLWGGRRERIPAYAMVGWLNHTPEEAARNCERAVDQGFDAVKIKVGADSLAEDIRRVEAVPLPVATGENLYSKEAFARFLRMDAVDIVQPDLRRMGGPSALGAVGTMADGFGRPYASHGGGAVQANIMASLSNTHYLETGFVDEDSPFDIVDGHVEVPQGPGFSWD